MRREVQEKKSDHGDTEEDEKIKELIRLLSFYFLHHLFDFIQ